ncbi:MAG: hypothetical protein ACYDAY_08785 [Candidatus Dormibacteria bacterium]
MAVRLLNLPRLGLLAVAVVALSGSGVRPLAVNPPAPDPITQAPLDGCQRDPGALLSSTSPEWVYINDAQYRALGQTPPAQWITGTVSSGNALFQAVHTSGGDLPMGHTAYDFNVNVLPDPQYQFLVAGSASAGTGNYAGNGEDHGRLHTEWQDDAVPFFAWPEPGDRITELGSWVWDCGHWGTPSTYDSPDYVLPKVGQPCLGRPDPAQCQLTGEGSEFHPYRVLWVQRQSPPASPTSQSQGELYVSTTKTRAGIEADCAHAYPAANSAAYPPAYRACLATAPDWQDVSGDYSFFLPAPAGAPAGANVIYSAVDEGSSGAPAPTLTAVTGGVQVTFRLATAPGQSLQMAYRIFAGWDSMTALAQRVHVSFDRLDIHRAMDPGCTANAFGIVPTSAPVLGGDCPFSVESTRPNQLSTAPGDWNLYYDVNGSWGHLGATEFHPNDGDALQALGGVDIYVPSGQGWRLFVHGRECDLGSLGVMADCPDNTELADDNDVQGMILDVYSSVSASLGTHTTDAMTRKEDPTSTCPDVNTHGCYSLTYTVTTG